MNRHPLAATGRFAVAGGLLSFGALVLVVVGETTQGTVAFMESTSAKVSGLAGFVGMALLVVGLLGFAVRYAGRLGGSGRVALGVFGFATAIAVGATGTLGLVVPWLVGDYPAIGENPPAVVPPTFILSGLVMGIAGIVLAVTLRKAAAAPVWQTRLLVAGSLVTLVPLPADHFLVTIAIGFLVMAPSRERHEAQTDDEAAVIAR